MSKIIQKGNVVKCDDDRIAVIISDQISITQSGQVVYSGVCISQKDAGLPTSIKNPSLIADTIDDLIDDDR